MRQDGAWWWHLTAELLAERGVASEAPGLPSCGETGAPTGAKGPGLADDVASVRQVLTASDEPTVVVAHSYGGIVSAQAAALAGTFLQDCDPEIQRQAIDRTARQSLAVVSQPAAVRDLILGI